MKDGEYPTRTGKTSRLVTNTGEACIGDEYRVVSDFESATVLSLTGDKIHKKEKEQANAPSMSPPLGSYWSAYIVRNSQPPSQYYAGLAGTGHPSCCNRRTGT